MELSFTPKGSPIAITIEEYEDNSIGIVLDDYEHQITLFIENKQDVQQLIENLMFFKERM